MVFQIVLIGIQCDWSYQGSSGLPLPRLYQRARYGSSDMHDFKILAGYGLTARSYANWSYLDAEKVHVHFRVFCDPNHSDILLE